MNTLEDKYTIGYEYEAHPSYYMKDLEEKLKDIKRETNIWHHKRDLLYSKHSVESYKNALTIQKNPLLNKTQFHPEGCGDISGIEYKSGIFDSLQFSKEYADHLLNHIVTIGTAYHPGAGIHVHISKFKNELKQRAIFSFFMNPNYYPHFHKISDRKSYLTWMQTVKGKKYHPIVKDDITRYTGSLPQSKGTILVYRPGFYTYEFRLFAAKPENLHPAIDMLTSIRNTIDEKNDYISWNDWINFLKSHKKEYEHIINKLNEYKMFVPFSKLEPYSIPKYTDYNTW